MGDLAMVGVNARVSVPLLSVLQPNSAVHPLRECRAMTDGRSLDRA
jgi:hypothetical protein